MGGIGSGPQKTPAGLIKEAKEKDARNLPQYFVRLSELALEGDREALFYLIDRHLGKSKTSIELEGTEKLGTGLVTQLFTLIAQERRKFLTEGQEDAEGAG